MQDTYIKNASKKKNRGLSTSVICIILFLASCTGYQEGTTLGSSLAVRDIQYSPVAAEKSTGVTPILVSLRYPASISPDAEALFSEEFAKHRPGQSDTENESSESTDNGVQETISKTIYFVNEIYQGLEEMLPQGTVILQPQEVVLEGDALAFRPLIKVTPPPSVLVVDFMTYSHDREQMLEDVPLTFADLVTPVISVNTSIQASPTTLGSLVTTEYFQTTKAPLGETGDTSDSTNFILTRLFQTNVDADPLEIPETSSRPIEPNHVLSLPFITIKLDLDTSNITENASLNNIQDAPFFNAAAAAYTNTVVELLNNIDHRTALREKRREYIRHFDPKLAMVYPFGDTIPDLSKRLAALRKFEDIERTFLAKESRNLAEKIYNGDYGQTMRKMIAQEYDLLKQRRQIADEEASNDFNEGLNMFGAVLSIAAQVATLNPNMSAFQQADITNSAQNLSNISIANLEESAVKGKALADEDSKVQSSFEENFSQIYSNQSVAAKVEIGEGVEIVAPNLQILRKKILSRYKKFFYEIPKKAPIDETCKAAVPQADETMTTKWYGMCVNGQANKFGVAMLYANGEYVGEFEGNYLAGQPQGAGTLILKDKETGLFTKTVGIFDGETLNGSFVVNTSGDDSETVEYEAGKAKGFF